MAELRADVIQAREQMTIVFGARREIRKLDEYLRDDEQVERMIAGMYIENEDKPNQKDEGRGLLVLTSRRVLFVKDGVFARASHDFMFSRIDSVEWHSGLFLGELLIHSTDEKVGIHGVWRGDGKLMADLIRDRLGGSHETAMSTGSTAVPTPGSWPRVNSPADPVATLTGEAQDELLHRLERLGVLREKGHLTEVEFQEAKQRLFA